MPGLSSRSCRTSVSESVTADLIFLAIAFGVSSRRIVPSGDSSVFDIFFVGVLQIHDARPDRGEGRLRDDERVAEGVVEPDRDVARQLDVLALVVADGDLVGVVEEDVGGHQHRIVEEADAHELLALGLLLELRHPPQLAERRGAVEDPRELGVGPNVALDEQQGAVGIEAGGHQPHRHAAGRGRSARAGRRAR